MATTGVKDVLATDAKEAIAFCEENDVRFVRLWFTDLLGQLKSFSIHAADLDAAFQGGTRFDGSSTTGFNPIEEPDMITMLDPTTLRIIPWRPVHEKRTARMFCDIRVPGGEPYEGDPRWIMRRALERAKEMGFDDYFIGPELEYFYFRSANPEDGITPEVLDEGGPSQHEVDMRYKGALAMSDDCMTYRITVKEYAMKYGWHATFMPKPLQGENGSGMHVHQSLSRDGRNAFFDPDDQYFLSDVAKAFIAGQLKHAREIAPLFAQWVNSYKRLVPGFEAPTYLAWSRRNRSALIRVPLYHPGIEELPETLGEAIDIAAHSELVLRILGEHTFNRFVEIKRAEWADYRVQVTPWEVDRFL